MTNEMANGDGSGEAWSVPLTREELERRANAGDFDAMADLGASLIHEGGGRDAVLRGARLVEEAADRGSSRGRMKLALFAGSGLFVPQDWERAFDLVAAAAESGFAPAQGQLSALARRSPGSQSDGAYWRDLRAGIDIAALMTPPPARALCEASRIGAAAGFAAPEECDWIMSRAAGRLERAQIYPDVTGDGAVTELRTNSETSLSFLDWDLVILIVQARMARLTPYPPFALEPPSIMRYEVGQKFEPHYDFLDPALPRFKEDLGARGQRIATFLVYLNDGFEGGETTFPKRDITFKGAKGDALYFYNVTPAGAPDHGALHAGLPPTSGEKWLLSQWIRERAPG